MICFDPTEMLNLNQSPEELADLYGERDYYAYLRSPQFKHTFLKQIGELIHEICGDWGRVLDVACGEGQLAEFVRCDYCGIDGSAKAIERGILAQIGDRHRFPLLTARMEDPPSDIGYFNTIVFGGVLEVLIKPDHRVEFVNLYRDRYQATHFIVYDLERLDTGPLESTHRKLREIHASVEEMPGLIDVKRHRKTLAFEYAKGAA